MVQANGTAALAVITQLQPVTVIFNVAEDDLPQILAEVHQGKTLAVDAFDRAQTHKLAEGTLETLDNQIDPNTGTVKFRAIFTNADESLFPNQFVNARLLVKMLDHATLLPNAIIQRNAEGSFVYVVKPDESGATNASPANAAGSAANAAPATNSPAGGGRPASTPGTVTMVPVATSTTDGNVTAVEGIEPGTVVAADNFNKLTDGAKVMIRPHTAGEGGSAGGPHTGAGPHTGMGANTGTNAGSHHRKNPTAP